MIKNKYGWAVILVIVFTLAAISSQAVFSQSSEPGLHLDVSADPTTVETNQPVNVTLTILGNDQACAAEEIYRPLSVALAVDRSGSMREGLGTTQTTSKMKAAVDAVGTFLTLLDEQKDQASLISFAGNDRLDVPLSAPSKASSALPQDDTGMDTQSTNIEGGLRTAYETIKSVPSEDASRVVVLLTDGNESTGSAAGLAEEVKKSGVRIVTIGLGPEVSENLLRNMASQPSDYYYAPRVEDLKGVYESIARMVKEYDPATDIQVVYEFDASNFTLLPESITPPASQVVSNRVEWQFSKLDVNKQQMNLTLIANSPGTYNAIQSATLNYKRCGKEDVSEMPSVQFPISVGGEIPPILCDGNSVSTKSTAAFLCGLPWGWVIGLLAFILLLLWFFSRNQDTIRAWLRCGVSPLPCFWSRLLWNIFLSIVLGVIANSVSGYACAPRSGMMYWRIYPDLTSAIYLQPADQTQAAQPITPLVQQENCVGCHTVSNNAQSLAGIANGTNGKLVRWSYEGQRQYLPDIQGSYPAYSPDGTKIAYAANNEDIYILDIASGISRPLEGASQPGEIESMPAWNADGSQIAFVRAAGSNQSSTITTPCDILVVPAGGGSPTLVAGASSYGFNYHPAFSPDGKWLAFVHHETGTTTYGDPKAEIYLVPSDGGSPRRLSVNDGPGGQSMDMGNTWPVWSDDGKKLYFSSLRCDNQYDIFQTTISPEGNSTPADRVNTFSDSQANEFGAQEVKLTSISLGVLLGKLLPWLIPLLLWWLLNRILCRKKRVKDTDSVKVEILESKPSEGRLTPKQQFQVTIEMTGTEINERRSKPEKVDAVLLIDCSGSMAAKANLVESRLAVVRKASKRFIRCFMSPSERLGIASFGTQAKEIQPITVNEKDLIHAVNLLLPNQGGTEMSTGIRLAQETLLRDARKRANRVIVLFTDGEPTDSKDDVLTAAQQAREAGIRMIVVGTANANTELMRQLVQDPSDHVYVQNIKELGNIFLTISRRLLKPVAATDIWYTHKYDVQNFELIQESVSPQPEEINMEEGSIKWRIEELTSREVDFNYKVRPIKEGKTEIALPGTVDYIHGGSGNRRSTGTPGGALVNVLPGPRVIRHRILQTPITLREPQSIWQPDRALIIAVGTAGRWVLTYMLDNFLNAGHGKLVEGIQLLAIDTHEHADVRLAQTTSIASSGIMIDPNDLFVMDENLNTAIRNAAIAPLPEFRGWFKPENYQNLGNQVNLAQGTFGRRPIPRFGLLRLLDDPQNTNSTWVKKLPDGVSPQLKEWIRERCNLVKSDTNRIRVILVGSLHGGMGGIIADVAMLARKVAQQQVEDDGVVHLEGYFIDGALADAFTAAEEIRAEKKANSIAAIRELARLQMNPGYLMPVGWKNGHTIDTPLFDDLMLFSPEPNPEFSCKQYPETQPPDEMGPSILANYIYPSVADTITLLLDKAMKIAGPGDQLNTFRSGTRDHMNQMHAFVVNGAGVYSVRIAAASLLRSLHVRWAYELIRGFLTGQDERGIGQPVDEINPLHWDMVGARDDLIPPGEQVIPFLSGELVLEESEAPIAMQVLAEYLRNNRSILQGTQEFQDYLALSEDTHMRHLAGRLAQFTRWILTGEQQGSRVERMAYVLQFLESLINQLEQLRNAQPQVQGDANLTHYVGNCIRAAQNIRTNLSNLRDLISQNQPQQPLGLWEEIRNSVKRLENIDHELDKIVNRQYIWGTQRRRPNGENQYVSFREEWWGKYLAGKVQNYLDGLDWFITEDNSIDLAIQIQGNKKHPVLLLKDGPTKFFEFIIKIASSLTVNVYQDIANNGILLQGVDQVTPEDMGKFSLPICGRITDAAAMAPDQLMLLVPSAAFTPQIGWGTTFGGRLLATATSGNLIASAPAILSISNPTMTALLHMRNMIDISKIAGYTNSLMRYDECDGYNPNVRRFPNALPQPRACFRGEYEARRLEKQAGYNYNQYGIIHPNVVAGLMYPGRAELFMLCFAEGRINQQPNGQIILDPPGGGPIPLVQNQIPDMDIYVQAYLDWVYKVFNREENKELLKSLSEYYQYMNAINFGPPLGVWVHPNNGVQAPLNVDTPPDRHSLGAAVSAIAKSFNTNQQKLWDINND